MSELERLQAIADLYAEREFAHHALTVEKPVAWKARVSSDFLKQHRGQVVAYLRAYPDASDETVLKNFRSGTKSIASHQIPPGQHPLRDCDRCDGSGWYFPDPAINEVKRCSCFEFRPPVREQQPRYTYIKAGAHYTKEHIR